MREVVLPEGDFRDDAKLATAASNALAQNVTVPDTVEATAQDGNISLAGTVSYGTERAAAEAVVTDVVGVRNVFVFGDLRSAPSCSARSSRRVTGGWRAGGAAFRKVVSKACARSKTMGDWDADSSKSSRAVRR